MAGIVPLGDWKGEGGDPRIPAHPIPDLKEKDYGRDSSSDQGVTAPGYIKPQQRLLHDKNVTFEEYHWYALRTRNEEDIIRNSEVQPKTRLIDLLIPPKGGANAGVRSDGSVSGDVNDLPDEERRKYSVTQNLGDINIRSQISDEEWKNASRALRSATWAACFYLITTDILGPFGVGFSLGTLGWGPGIALFTAFGLMAGYSGYLLWKMFLGLDSYEFPMRNYGDIAFRLYGGPARYVVNFLQSIQLLFGVGLIVISNGQALSQVSKFKLCYAVCCLIWAIVGFGVGQVRTLQKFGWLANAAVFINLMIMFITMGVMAHSPPNYAISVLGSAGEIVDATTVTPVNGVYPEIIHYSSLPNPNSLLGSINGLMQGVYAYGGAQLFVEFMAEMRQPKDFIKAMWGAQFFIYTVYMVYGCYCYYWQGQYVYQLAYQGVSPYGWQVVGNMLAIISGIIAAALYGNIGIKVFYNNILSDIFKCPPLNTKAGKIIWIIMVPIYWSIAFIIAASIPAFFGLVSVIAAFCIVQFCYSFPPILAIGYFMKQNAIRAESGEGFQPTTGQVVHSGSFWGRHFRGFNSGGAVQVFINYWNIIYAGGALSVAGLGAYAAIDGLIDAFKNPQINAFTCQSPLNLNA